MHISDGSMEMEIDDEMSFDSLDACKDDIDINNEQDIGKNQEEDILHRTHHDSIQLKIKQVQRMQQQLQAVLSNRSTISCEAELLSPKSYCASGRPGNKSSDNSCSHEKVVLNFGSKCADRPVMLTSPPLSPTRAGKPSRRDKSAINPVVVSETTFEPNMCSVLPQAPTLPSHP